MTTIFLHPPSIYDFRKSPVFLGPISDVVPSTQIFEMYPLGFVSMASYLDKGGFDARIVNLALKMLNNPKFDAENFIRKLDAEAFCIDLHWLVHTQGALKIAEICKRYHPEVPVIFGGFTSTYYHQEMLSKFPQLDYVLRGDSCELPLLKLMGSLDNSRDLRAVPNLSYRHDSRTISNPITHVPENLDEYLWDPKFLIKSILKSRDLEGHLPYRSWKKNPIMAVIPYKGCTLNCANCGGSKYTYQNTYCRSRMGTVSAKKIVEHLKKIESYIECPCFMLNDLRLVGEKYHREILDGIKKENIDLPMVFELFYPAEKTFMKDIGTSCERFNIEFSPEDASEKVRMAHGKNYSNEDIEKSIKYAFDYGCDKFDIFFMIGLGMQTRESVFETIHYIDELMNKFDGGKLYPFISPYAPTLDPGSLAFEHPQKYGYEIFYNSLEEHYRAFQMPSWKYFFNYRTQNFTPDDIIDLTYTSTKELYRIKEKYGLSSREEVESVNSQIQTSKEILYKIDTIFEIEDEKAREIALSQLKSEIKDTHKSLLCAEKELYWEGGKSIRSKVLALIMRFL